MTDEIEADGPVTRRAYLAWFTITDVVVPLVAIVGLFLGIVYFAAPYFQWAAVQLLEHWMDLLPIAGLIVATLTFELLRRRKEGYNA